jgi:MFS transporter, DHA2 family, lincomycin resistance protein
MCYQRICDFRDGTTHIGRIVQAIATGLISPLLINTILIICPPEKRGATVGLIALVMMSAPAIGPTLSGVIVDFLFHSC